MRYFFILICLFITKFSHAQSNLDYNKRFVESIDHWVAFQPDEEDSYIYGFIYVDLTVGLSVRYGGSFTINPNGEYVLEHRQPKTGVLISRLDAKNNYQVAFIPKNKFKILKIQKTPEWLDSYKEGLERAYGLYRMGYLYNAWGMCEKAIIYLEKARQKKEMPEGLLVEMAFSYNCLEHYNKAISVLNEALTTSPKKAYLYKELVYAQIKSGHLKKAEKTVQKALKTCKDTKYNGHMSCNILYSYLKNGDKKKFNKWLKISKKWSADNPRLLKRISMMENEMN